jgi:hypothetical protein
MPSWSDILAELQKTGSPHDVVRRKYLAELSALTGRNTIIYSSGCIQRCSSTSCRTPCLGLPSKE